MDFQFAFTKIFFISWLSNFTMILSLAAMPPFAEIRNFYDAITLEHLVQRLKLLDVVARVTLTCIPNFIKVRGCGVSLWVI